jgi:hypothetical protein
MRNVIVGVLTVAGAGLATTICLAAPVGPTQIAREASIVQQVQSYSYCRRLRRACENKDIRGEQGEGNCRRYRRVCGGRR